jgi:hypothetical protein
MSEDKVAQCMDALDTLNGRMDAMERADSGDGKKSDAGSETYYVQFDAKDESGKILVNRACRVEASSNSEAESKARKKAKSSMGLEITTIKSARPEKGYGAGS